MASSSEYKILNNDFFFHKDMMKKKIKSEFMFVQGPLTRQKVCEAPYTTCFSMHLTNFPPHLPLPQPIINERSLTCVRYEMISNQNWL